MSDVEQQRSHDELTRAFRLILATSEGKRIVFWMLEQCAIYQDAFAAENNATNYTLGRQSAGRRLIGMLDTIDPRIYPRLLLDIADLRAMDMAAASRVAENGEQDDEHSA